MKTFFKEIGKELKAFVGENVKGFITFGIILLMLILMFAIPKIILGIICSLLVFGNGVVFFSVILQDFQEGNDKGFKYPYLSRTLYIIAGVLNAVFFTCLLFLVIKAFFIL